MTSPGTRAWLEEELEKLDLEGRDGLFTHLICQEAPMFLADIRQGKAVDQSHVDWLIQRRGFNPDEAKKLQSLADWMNNHAAEIRDLELREISALG